MTVLHYVVSGYVLGYSVLQLCLIAWTTYQKSSDRNFNYGNDILHWQVLVIVWPVTLLVGLYALVLISFLQVWFVFVDNA